MQAAKNKRTARLTKYLAASRSIGVGRETLRRANRVRMLPARCRGCRQRVPSATQHLGSASVDGHASRSNLASAVCIARYATAASTPKPTEQKHGAKILSLRFSVSDAMVAAQSCGGFRLSALRLYRRDSWAREPNRAVGPTPSRASLLAYKHAELGWPCPSQRQPQGNDPAADQLACR